MLRTHTLSCVSAHQFDCRFCACTGQAITVCGNCRLSAACNYRLLICCAGYTSPGRATRTSVDWSIDIFGIGVLLQDIFKETVSSRVQRLCAPSNLSQALKEAVQHITSQCCLANRSRITSLSNHWSHDCLLGGQRKPTQSHSSVEDVARPLASYCSHYSDKMYISFVQGLSPIVRMISLNITNEMCN